jgi:hypothetical protein
MLPDKKAIAVDLHRTALNEGYYGRSLDLALGLPGITAKECDVIIRYLVGTQRGDDHIALQDIAYKIKNL